MLQSKYVQLTHSLHFPLIPIKISSTNHTIFNIFIVLTNPPCCGNKFCSYNFLLLSRLKRRKGFRDILSILITSLVDLGGMWRCFIAIMNFIRVINCYCYPHP